ncbi:MAG: hypothetical protein H0W82_08965 [Actinobacteria bacterium]|nr:hypothetical protein [Actinomycetota bacterium]
MGRGWIVAILAVIAVVVGGVVLLVFPDHGEPIDVSASQIDRIQAYPYPEGSQGPAFARVPGEGEIPLQTVISSLPIPLPPPTGCPDQVVLRITLVDGTRIEYGHCDYPEDMKALNEAMQTAWRTT